MSAPAALIFDVFGTCVDWRTGAAEHCAPILAEAGAGVEAIELVDSWRELYYPSMVPIRRGEEPYVELDVLHRRSLETVLPGLGLAETFTESQKEALCLAWERLPAWPDAVPGLTAIRRNHIIAPCSNGSFGMMTRLARHAGLPWDCILGASLAKTYKTEPAVYLTACDLLQLPPDRIMMVAAHNNDLAAARGHGLRTAFFPRPREYGPGQTSDLEPAEDWDIVADDIEDLSRRLEK